MKIYVPAVYITDKNYTCSLYLASVLVATMALFQLIYLRKRDFYCMSDMLLPGDPLPTSSIHQYILCKMHVGTLTFEGFEEFQDI